MILVKVDALTNGEERINSLKRVLIVSFHFPPLNSIAAVRVGKLAKYLPEFGWEPIVLTVDRVKGQSQTLPVEIDERNIVRTPYFALAPFIRYKLIGDVNTSSQGISKGFNWGEATYRLMRPMRFIYLRPEVSLLIDEPLGWYPYALRKGLGVINKSKVDVIFSTFGPRMSHFIASRLHKRTGILWVAEFQDPWALNQYMRKIQPFQFLEEKVEKWVMKGSCQLITVSEPLARRLEVFHSKEITVIPLGFDQEDYVETTPLTPKFTITFTGSIYPGKRDPTHLFEAVKLLQQEGKVSPDDFEIRFFGSNSSVVLPFIEKYHLEQLVKLFRFIPFKESVRRQKESTVLLLLTWNDSREWTYPGKIFEYFGAGRPILASAFKGGAIDSLLAKSGCGIVANEVGEIKNILSRWLQEFKKYGDIISHYSPNSEVISAYTQKQQARKLAEVLERVSESQEVASA